MGLLSKRRTYISERVLPNWVKREEAVDEWATRHGKGFDSPEHPGREHSIFAEGYATAVHETLERLGRRSL